MIALGGPKLKRIDGAAAVRENKVSMIALGGPKLKPPLTDWRQGFDEVSMIALGGPKLKPEVDAGERDSSPGFNDSTGWA